MFMALLYRKIFLYHNHPSSLAVEEVLVIEGILDPIYDPPEHSNLQNRALGTFSVST